MFRITLLFMAVAILVLHSISAAGDRVTFSSGQTVICTVVEYSDGSITVVDEEGRKRSASIDQIERIVFEHDKQAAPSPWSEEPADRSPAGDGVLSASEVLANVDSLKDETVEITGNVSGTDSAFGTASDESFVIVLEDLRVEIGREVFRRQYFELKKIRGEPCSGWPSRYPYYEMRFSQGGRSVTLIEKQQERHRYSGGRWRYRERTVGAENIMDSGERIRVRGSVRTRGRRTYVDNARLLAIE